MYKGELLGLYNYFRDKEHVFIYSVCGRSSSTALQRILNSSGKICVYGEPHYLSDKFIDAIKHMKWMNQDPMFAENYRLMKQAFQQQNHSLAYANAMPQLDKHINLMASLLCDIFKPLNKVDRFGFKDIRIQSSRTLKGLTELFPKSHIIFLFRNPLKQWPSVRDIDWWDYSRDIHLFLREYKRMSDIYLDHLATDENSFFIHNRSLYDKDKVRTLIQNLGLGGYDNGLIGDKVLSAKKKGLSLEEENTIKKSEAWKNYNKMLGFCYLG